MNSWRKGFARKGFTYVLIVSFLLAVLLVVFLTVNNYHYQDSQELYQKRILVMNDFVKGLNQDIMRASFISGFRTLVALEDYTSRSGVFLNNTADSFKETFYYGTINGTPATIMNDSSFSDYLARVNMLAANIGLAVNITVIEIQLDQSDPWSVDITVIAQVNISDTRKLASWKYVKAYTTNVPIYNLRDPLYGFYTHNTVPNTIRVLNTTTLVYQNNTENLTILLNESYYIASPDAPNFLMRFENRSDANPYGIQSVVNIPLLSDQGLEVYPNRIKVDYMYFNNIDAPKICAISGIPATLYTVLSQSQIALYQVQGLNYSTTCP